MSPAGEKAKPRGVDKDAAPPIPSAKPGAPRGEPARVVATHFTQGIALTHAEEEGGQTTGAAGGRDVRRSVRVSAKGIC